LWQVLWCVLMLFVFMFVAKCVLLFVFMCVAKCVLLLFVFMYVAKCVCSGVPPPHKHYVSRALYSLTIEWLTPVRLMR